MTHVGQYGLFVLWCGLPLEFIFFGERMDAWTRATDSEVTQGVAREAACGAGGGGADVVSVPTGVRDSLPTCPACAVLCDMARGAE